LGKSIEPGGSKTIIHSIGFHIFNEAGHREAVLRQANPARPEILPYLFVLCAGESIGI
jgi:hypothetical protein